MKVSGLAWFPLGIELPDSLRVLSGCSVFGQSLFCGQKQMWALTSVRCGP